MHLELERVILAPPLRVFEFFADPRNRPRWQRSLSSVTMLTQGEPGLGTRWQESPPGLGVVTMEITAFEPPTRWAERGVSKVGRLDLCLRFSTEGEGTRLRLDADLELPSFLRWGVGLAKPFMLREVRNDLARAAEILDARAPA